VLHDAQRLPPDGGRGGGAQRRGPPRLAHPPSIRASMRRGRIRPGRLGRPHLRPDRGAAASPESPTCSGDRVQTPTPCDARHRYTAPAMTRSTTLGRVLAVELNAGTDNPLVFADDEAVALRGELPRRAAGARARHREHRPQRARQYLRARLFRMLTGFLSSCPRSSPGTRPRLRVHAAPVHGRRPWPLTISCSPRLPASIRCRPRPTRRPQQHGLAQRPARAPGRDQLEAILALEALGAAQGIDLLAPLKPGRLTRQAHAAIREKVSDARPRPCARARNPGRHRAGAQRPPRA